LMTELGADAEASIVTGKRKRTSAMLDSTLTEIMGASVRSWASPVVHTASAVVRREHNLSVKERTQLLAAYALLPADPAYPHIKLGVSKLEDSFGVSDG
jgi:hypothetical protein